MDSYSGCSSITLGTIQNSDHQFYQNKIMSVISKCINKQNIDNLEFTCALYVRSMQDLFVSIYTNILKDHCNLNALRYKNTHCSYICEPVLFAKDKGDRIISIINHDIISKLYMNTNIPTMTMNEYVKYKLNDDIVFDLAKTSSYMESKISALQYKYIKLSKALSKKVIRLYVIADHAAQHFLFLLNSTGPKPNANLKHIEFNRDINHLSFIFSKNPDKRKHKLLYSMPDKDLFKEVHSNYDYDDEYTLIDDDFDECNNIDEENSDFDELIEN
ncbi:hypothetical protein TONV_031 [Tipula oleracea nudivirus]|uniref:DUF3388 domain-containing protein n=1 Tax=Tipula oleracea nudivirus TaxID=1546257 RepID=A0A0B4VG44_9VIRU|nr:hypothetical protein TONV_031 [Tipula oleracea nudivirus]AJD20091.1 hypothetical protein TONV_031 [Tipula oleracea nudivirus]